jgi:hypothetical protein
MPLNYKKVTTTAVYGPTENELKKRNNTVREVLNAKGIPRNVGEKEVLSRVKVYNKVHVPNMKNYMNNVRTLKGMRRYGNDLKMKISNFITNGRVFNQRKRKALVDLMFRFKTLFSELVLQILELKNVDVINYLKYSADYFERWGLGWGWSDREKQKFFRELTYKGWKGNSLSSISAARFVGERRKAVRITIREDPAAVRVLKKRTAFLKKMLKFDWPKDPSNILLNLPKNVLNNFDNVLHEGYGLYISDVWDYMQKVFPLPPHPKNAATKIQKTVRGMRNRKKLTTMRKAATTIQKTVRGMINRKKMKTVAGKRKASTSIKTTSAGKRKRSPQ